MIVRDTADAKRQRRKAAIALVWRRQFAGMNPLNPLHNAKMAMHILRARCAGDD